MSTTNESWEQASDADVFERSSDWLNPILVKETRQALKSRQFLVTFTLMLVSAWLISVFGVLLAGDSLEYGSAGRIFFLFYYYVLALAIFGVVPYSAYRGLLNERDQTTLELLSITTLTPRQFVWGKLCSSMVQVFIYYSAIAPFIAFTSLLQGFDLAQVAFVLTASLLASFALTMLALTLAAIPQSKHAQGGTTLLYFGAKVWMGFAVAFGMPVLFMEAIPFDQHEFWVIVGCFITAGLSFVYLFQQVAVAHLTFESDNRSTGIRFACTIQQVLYWSAIGVVLKYVAPVGATPRIGSEEVAVMATFAILHATVIGFFSATELDFTSRRVRRNFAKGWLLKLVSVPFMPGGHRGFVYLLLHLLTIPFVCRLMFGNSFASGRWDGWWIVTMILYVVAYLGIGSALGRMLRSVSPDVRAVHTRVIILIVFLIGLIVPYLPGLFGLKDAQNHFLTLRIANPFEFLNAIAGNSSLAASGMWGSAATIVGPIEFAVLWMCAGLGVLLNVPAMFRGLLEVLAPATPKTNVALTVANAQGPSA